MGAIAGALVAASRVESSTCWTPSGMTSLAHAEDLLRGRPTPIDLSPAEAVPIAVGLAGGPPPLLVESATTELCDVIRTWLDSSQLADVHNPDLAAAIDLARPAPRFADVLAELDETEPTRVVLTAAMVGMVGGLGTVPARLVSTIEAPDGRRGRRYLARLTDRLLEIDRTPTYDPRNRRGPREVLPGLWLANLFGVKAFTEQHPDGLVLSLCDPEGRLDRHEHQITFHLDDTPKADANPSLNLVIDEVLTEIAGARKSGQPVLVHCRHGASRTGLILRLLLIDELTLDAESALTEAQCLWPHTSEWNIAWRRATEARQHLG